MLFNSFAYLLVYLPLGLAGFFWLGRFGETWALTWLLLASLVFYAWWNPFYVLLLLASIGVNFGFGRAIQRTAGLPRGALLTTGIGLNLLVLGYYKYAGFLLGLAGLHVDVAGVVLPLGISFFTFTQISYLIDCSRGVVKQSHPLHYALFVTYFPHLVAGPIIAYPEMIAQFRDRRILTVDWRNMAGGLSLLTVGLSKKVLLADQFATWADPAFSAVSAGTSLTPIEAYAGAIAFMLQIYFDFSAYCDLALGASAMFGVLLPLNFNSPFKAVNMIDFWQRWNMTLTRFLIGYVYRPMTAYLARARASKGKVAGAGDLSRDPLGFLTLIVLPTMATMLIAGLWHGAGVQYLLFGLIFGLFLVINQTWRRLKRAAPRLKAGLADFDSWAGRPLTMVGLLVGFVAFRATSLAGFASMLSSMIDLDGLRLAPSWITRLGVLAGPLSVLSFAEARPFQVRLVELAGLAAGVAIVWLAPNPYQLMRGHPLHLGVPVQPWRAPFGLPGSVAWTPVRAWAAVIAVLGVAALLAMGGHVVQFVYFRF